MCQPVPLMRTQNFPTRSLTISDGHELVNPQMVPRGSIEAETDRVGAKSITTDIIKVNRLNLKLLDKTKTTSSGEN